MLAALSDPMEEGRVRLELFQPAHVEGLRAACGEDERIWEIYPVSWAPDRFNETLRRATELAANRQRVTFSVVDLAAEGGARLVGMTSYIHPDQINRTLEIGATYVVPSLRGTGFNDTMKRLMIDRACQAGFRRIQFNIDTRNERSMGAVEKLGAVREGTLRKNLITWNGYVRDTAIFGLLCEEWRERQAPLAGAAPMPETPPAV